MASQVLLFVKLCLRKHAVSNVGSAPESQDPWRRPSQCLSVMDRKPDGLWSHKSNDGYDWKQLLLHLAWSKGLKVLLLLKSPMKMESQNFYFYSFPLNTPVKQRIEKYHAVAHVGNYVYKRKTERKKLYKINDILIRNFFEYHLLYNHFLNCKNWNNPAL